MHVIPEQLWNQIHVKTWKNLDQNLWMDFRLALLEAKTEKEVQGVLVYYTKAFNEVFTELEAQGVNIEFSPVILSATTEMITNIVVSQKDYRTAMLSYLPYFERDNQVFKAVLSAYDREFRRVEQDLEIAERNTLLHTAIERLSVYERDLGIRSINELDYKQRREQIVSRYRGGFEQTTEETIKNVAASYNNGEVEINKTDTLGVYEVKFVGTIGVPDNMSGLKEAVSMMIPAHLDFKCTFVYSPWNSIANKTWQGVSEMNWNEIREWKEVV